MSDQTEGVRFHWGVTQPIQNKQIHYDERNKISIQVLEHHLVRDINVEHQDTNRFLEQKRRENLEVLRNLRKQYEKLRVQQNQVDMLGGQKHYFSSVSSSNPNTLSNLQADKHENKKKDHKKQKKSIKKTEKSEKINPSKSVQQFFQKSKLQNMINDYSNRITHFLEEEILYKKKIHELQETINQLQENQNSKIEKSQVLSQQKVNPSQKNKQIIQFQHRLSQQMRIKTTLISKITNLQQKNEKIEQQNKELAQKIKNLTQQALQNRVKIKQLNFQAEKARKQFQINIKAQKLEYKVSYACQSDNNPEICLDNHNYRQIVANLQRQLQLKIKEIGQLRAKYFNEQEQMKKSFLMFAEKKQMMKTKSMSRLIEGLKEEFQRADCMEEKSNYFGRSQIFGQKDHRFDQIYLKYQRQKANRKKLQVQYEKNKDKSSAQIKQLQQKIENLQQVSQTLKNNYEKLQQFSNKQVQKLCQLINQWQKKYNKLQKSSEQMQKRYQNEIKDLKRKADSAQFEVTKIKQSNQLQNEYYKKKSVSDIELQKQTIDRLQNDRNILRMENEGLKNSIEQLKSIIRDQQFRQKNRLKDQELVIKKKLEEQIKQIKQKHFAQREKLLQKIDFLTDSNEKLSYNARRASLLQSQNSQLKSMVKQSVKSDENIMHLWSIKQVEYHNAQDILAMLRDIQRRNNFDGSYVGSKSLVRFEERRSTTYYEY